VRRIDKSENEKGEAAIIRVFMANKTFVEGEYNLQVKDAKGDGEFTPRREK